MPVTARPTRSAQGPAHAPREMSLLRIVAQGLVSATTAPDPAEAVRRHLAIQGQQPSAVPHAIVSRVASASGADVEEAFASGRLVRSWPMRGTVHITTAQDHHWLRVALQHRMGAWMRASEDIYGVDDRVVATAAEVALALLAGGAVPRADLLGAWEEAGLMEPFKGEDVSAYRRRHLLLRLQLEGILVQGPKRSNEHLVVDARGLPEAATGPGGAGGGAHGTDSHRAALAEIARRYATSHGPVSAADLARWTTLPVREAARALEDAVETTNAAGYAVDPSTGHAPLTRAAAEGGLRGTVVVLGPGESAAATRGDRVGGRDGGSTGVLYMRADLPDLLAADRRAAAATHFLASFDELHVGYKDRLCLTDAAGERLICPSMNGMFRPLLVDRGRVVAVRPVGHGLLWADDARRSAPLEGEVERAVRAVERRLAG
ncbi:DNA glycosylase AlkZ-like family protein [Actinomyces howellii]|uniref:Winged helix DNA-binding domain-containing protein n=1 Tax=Actinomyces howellii TaxID=52771 RepID=A0A3S4R2T7_9ACTO|nr:crosslink repair DNA glycosylase YcaQ family protein [Actinomyces howellii]VEG27328.1 Uncharacterised protein [Actinomyces howellii]